MTTQYTIYLVNNSATTQIFWCFLTRPVELASDPGVYANSSTSLAVASMAPGINTFTIPVQYIVGAGASNNAVGLNIKIDSIVTQDTDLGQMWDANYATVPPNMGPSLALDSASAPAGTIAIKSNAFNRGSNEANGWFSNMSYGVQTNQGFIGMSWSPSPQQTRTITPVLKFYVTTGSYGANSLASWTDVANDSAMISVPSSFQYNKTTVTYTDTGAWIVTPGAPSMLASADFGGRGGVFSLIQSHRLLSEAHAKLIGLARPAADCPALPEPQPNVADGTQEDALVNVQWDPRVTTSELGEIVLTGTLTVATALTAAFTVFVLGGVTFSITRAPVGGTTVKFSYSGTKSVEAVKALFAAGRGLLFS
jgi:hypothetical protein